MADSCYGDCLNFVFGYVINTSCNELMNSSHELDPPKLSQKRAVLLGLATVLCWSTVATAFKLSLAYLSPVQLVLMASVTSTLFLTLMLFLQGSLSALWGQTFRVYKMSLLFGLLNPTLYYLLLFWAYDLLPAQEAQAINYSWAIVMTFMAVPLLKQRLYWYDYIAAIFCYLGVCFIATHGDLLGMKFASVIGVGLAVLSTVVWSTYWVFNQKDQREPVLGLCLNFMMALPIIIAIAAWRGELNVFANPWQAWAGGIYVGLFEMGLAFVLWLSAMKRAESTAQLANLIFISPFLSLFFIAFFLGEAILFSTVVGLVLIVTGLVLQQFFRKKPLDNIGRPLNE